MAYEGKNKQKVEELKLALSDESIRDVVDTALTGRGNETKLDTVFDAANSSDREILAEIYLISRDNYADKLTDSMNYWKKIFSQLGFNHYDNPFMVWLDNYFSLGSNQTLPAEGVQALNNLYANGKISGEELQGKTKDGKKTLLYNNNLYNHHADEIEFYVDAYKALQNKKTTDSIKNLYPNWASLNEEQIIKKILFGSQNATVNTSVLLSPTEVKEILDKIKFDSASASKTSEKSSSKLLDVENQLKKMTKEEIASIFKSLSDAIPGLADELKGGY